jgi:glycosyltransferase involved in cell wall biosynthesis
MLVPNEHQTTLSATTIKAPRVSIGLPVYNGEPFIRDALDSLLAQTFSDFELIISDNASTDETETICRDYAAKDGRIRYLRWPENRGGVPNFQFLLDEAVGEFFMWAPADDWWSDNWLAENVKELEKGDVLLSFGKSVRTKADLSIDGQIKSYSFRSDNVMARLIYFFMLDENTKGNLFYGLVKTAFMKEFGINFSQTNYGTEYPHIYKLLVLGKIGCAGKALLKKRSPIDGLRRYQMSFYKMIFEYLVSFKNVLNRDRYKYYSEFVRLTPSVFGKVLLVACIPSKVIISIFYEYLRGAQSGINVIRKLRN